MVSPFIFFISGTPIIACLEMGRNCMTVENSSVRYIHGKISCVDVLGKKTDGAEDGDQSGHLQTE